MAALTSSAFTETFLRYHKLSVEKIFYDEVLEYLASGAGGVWVV